MKSEPDSVRFYASEYADKLTFDAVPEWLTAALDSGDIKGVFKGEDYWYLEVKTAAGVATAEPGDSVSRRDDGTLHVTPPGGISAKTMNALAAYARTTGMAPTEATTTHEPVKLTDDERDRWHDRIERECA